MNRYLIDSVVRKVLLDVGWQ